MTTTIRLDDQLKAKVALAAQSAGMTTHAFILDAIARTVEQAEAEDAFDRLADERWAEFLATGETIPWDEAKIWLEARVAGQNVARPVPRKLKI